MAKHTLKNQKKSWFSSLKDLFTGNRIEDNATVAADVTRPQVSESTLTEGRSMEDFEIVLPPGVNKIEFVNALLRMGPEDHDHLYFDGECDNSTLSRQMAYRVAREAFNDLPQDASSLESLGFSLIELGDHKRALKCYLRQSKKASNDGAVWNNIAWCQMRLGRYEEALVSCERAMKFLSNHSYVHHDYAAILAGLGRLDEAVEVIKNATNLKPEAPQLYYLLASVLEKKGDIKSAISYWKEYLKLADGKAGHERAVLRAQERLRRYGINVSLKTTQISEKEKLFNNLVLSHILCLNQHMQLVKREPKKVSMEERMRIGKSMERILEGYNDAVDKLSQKVRALPIRDREILSRHYSFLSLANLLQERLDEVSGWLKKSIELDKNNKQSQALLYAYYVIKVMHGVDEKEEYRLIQSALKIDSRPGHAHILLARHYCYKRKYRQIEKILTQINDTAGKKSKMDTYERALLEEAIFGVTLWMAVGKILDNKDNEALGIIDGLIRKRPDAPELKYWLVIINIRKGSYSKAQKILETIPTDAIPPKILSELRDILYRRVIVEISEYSEIFNLRGPRMTGSSSSPICLRSLLALFKGLAKYNLKIGRRELWNTR
jgi:tetratricopeptide (TPR) repeat protein